MSANSRRTAYLFLDEGGNLDFSPKGSEVFTMTSVLSYRPFVADTSLIDLKFDLIERGFDVEYFHATEDKQAVRDRVFDLIQQNLPHFRADSIVVRKRKTAPDIRDDLRFYPDILGYLLRYVMHPRNTSDWSDVVIITDQLPIAKRRKAVKKAIQQSLATRLPEGVPFKIYHHSSKSCCGLQIADYFNWAVFRKWERGDERSYSLIKEAVKSEFDIFRNGNINWY